MKKINTFELAAMFKIALKKEQYLICAKIQKELLFRKKNNDPLIQEIEKSNNYKRSMNDCLKKNKSSSE